MLTFTHKEAQEFFNKNKNVPLDYTDAHGNLFLGKVIGCVKYTVHSYETAWLPSREGEVQIGGIIVEFDPQEIRRMRKVSPKLFVCLISEAGVSSLHGMERVAWDTYQRGSNPVNCLLSVVGPSRLSPVTLT